jgi:hypothetical protein
MMAYATLDELKRYLGITKGDDNTLLLELLVRSQKTIDNYTHRVFEAAANTSRTFDAERDVDGDTLWLDEDLASINSITNGDATTVTSSQYVTEPRNRTPYYAIKIRSDAAVAWTYGDYHENAITISGKWAYSAAAPADIQMATIRLSAFYYRQKDTSADLDRPLLTGDGITIMPSQIPNDVRQLIEPYRKAV